MIDKVDALHSLRPNSIWSLQANVLNWQDSKQTEPTEAEIDAEIKRLQAEYDANQYQRDRADSYPSWQEQMDLIYHSGVEGLKAELKKTKDKYPKG